MLNAQIAIIGGGLSGLYAAHLLAQNGISYFVFEARSQLGGRLLSLPVSGMQAADAREAVSSTANPEERFDLGATWFWPSMQPRLLQIIDELGVGYFPQPDAGDWLLERSRTEPPARVNGYSSAAASMRVSGGLAAVTDALVARLEPERVTTSCQVVEIEMLDRGLRLHLLANGVLSSTQVDHVLLALPPRLASESIKFTPSLPLDLSYSWQGTPTWMAPHAKYLAVFDEPFWRADGLAGAAQSSVGPMVELHDASTQNGLAALFGFIGLPARARAGIKDAELLGACRSQLVRLYGEQARLPIAEVLHDWSREPFTATHRDATATGHAVAPRARATEGPWLGRLCGAASEWSPEFPGYVAGAVDAAERAVGELLKTLEN